MQNSNLNMIRTDSKNKYELGMLSLQEKKKFYRQELFEGNNYLRKHLLTMLAFFVFLQIPNLMIHLKYIQISSIYERTIVPISFILGMICIGLSFITRFKKSYSQVLSVQFILLLFGNIFALCCIISRVYFYIQRASKELNTETVIDGIIISASCLYFSKLLDICNPLWYFKITGPVAYFVAWIASSHQFNSKYVYLTYLSGLFGLIGVIMIEWVQASFRWNLFVKKTDNETWNAIHKLILNKVPSPIAVLNIKGEITYSNLEFDKLCEKKFESFCKRLKHIKRRGKIIKNDGEERDESDEYAQIVQNYPKVMEKQAWVTDENIEDLMQLIIHISDLMTKGSIGDNDCFTFDGKLYDEKAKNYDSFELTFSFMIEYQKIILILRNTTDHARLVTLESTSQYKDKLLASVSHELRTPLNGNLSLIETTIDLPDVPQAVKDKLLVPAYRSGKLLSHLINDILDYSQIGAKKLRLNFQELSIVDTIRNCHQLLELQAKRKGVDFKLVTDEKVSNFTTDHDRVTQIILNLLSNALKFTFYGSICLTAKLISSSNLKISVKDTGIGIKPEDLKKLFQEFTRIEGQDQVQFNSKGVELGLTIANKLARRLGRNNQQSGISVESVYGQGSCFSFTIIDKKSENHASFLSELIVEKKGVSPDLEQINRKTNEEPSSKNSSLPFLKSTEELNLDNLERDLSATIPVFVSKGLTSTTGIHTSRKNVPISESASHRIRKVLIVDDEPFNILAIESFLYSYNIQVDTAFNGKDAVDKVLKSNQSSSHKDYYDLIFMDCQMPVMDGYEATRTLRNLMNTKEINYIPIVSCTAFNSNEILSLCYEVGMVQVIEKPMSKIKFEKIVNRILYRNSE